MLNLHQNHESKNMIRKAIYKITLKSIQVTLTFGWIEQSMENKKKYSLRRSYSNALIRWKIRILRRMISLIISMFFFSYDSFLVIILS